MSRTRLLLLVKICLSSGGRSGSDYSEYPLPMAEKGSSALISGT